MCSYSGYETIVVLVAQCEATEVVTMCVEGWQEVPGKASVMSETDNIQPSFMGRMEGSVRGSQQSS